jgi:hypothetical protein
MLAYRKTGAGSPASLPLAGSPFYGVGEKALSVA